MKLTPFSALLPVARKLSVEPQRFLKARDTFADLLAEGGYKAWGDITYYILEFRLPSGQFSYGVSGLIDTLEYGVDKGMIRPHEATLKAREARQRISFLESTHLVKPVLLTCPAYDELQAMLQECCSCREPVVCLPAEYGVEVAVYIPSNTETLLRLGQCLDKTPLPIAVADGHHRITTARNLATEPETAANFSAFPVVLMPANSLSIDSFLRSVAGDDRPKESVLSELSSYFNIKRVDAAAMPTDPGQWLLKHDSQLYQLNVDRPGNLPDAVWFDNEVLPAVFSIVDSTSDERLKATPAECTQEVLEELAETEPDSWHFLPPPVSMDTFFEYVAARKIFPPKSTRFMPRVPSGLIIKEL